MLFLAGDILRRTARRLPGKTAIICGDEHFDYASFDRRANRFANALLRRGIGKGAVVAIMSPNYPDYGVVYFGTARSGAVLANINARGTAKDVAQILNRTAATALVVEAGLLQVVQAARAEVPSLRHVIVFGSGSTGGPGIETLADFTRGAGADEPAVDLTEDDPLGLTFTGGTTGLPKGVLVSHRARGMSALTALVEFNLTENDIAAVTTPLFHTAGLFVWFHPAVMCGATCVFAPRWNVEEFLALIERHKVTAAVLVPTQINDLVKSPAFAAEKLRTLRKLNHAGMPMPVALIERMAELLPWVQLTDNYGTSETGPITARRPEHLPAKAASVGRAAFNVEVEIRAPDGGRVLPPGEVGEIVTRGDHVMLGYYNDPEATAAVFKSNDRWFWTGDLGYIDDDGFVVLVDRLKDVMILGGENIFPLEIEQVLYQHPAVGECAVVGIPDERLGEVPAAHVVLRAGMQATEQALMDFCLTRLARHKRPRVISFVAALPKTAVGKIEKHRIREPYWQGRDKRI